MEKGRRNREDIERLPGGGIFSSWKTIMVPKDDPQAIENPERFKDRKGEGLRLSSNTFSRNGGVYEVRVVPPGGGKPIVIYLGKAGGEDTNSSLHQRMGQYMRDGSHKGDMYDAFLKGGCKIQIRTVEEGASTRSATGSEHAKKVESHFLKVADYAANKMENGKVRFDEVSMVVNGRKVKMDVFLKKNGYSKGERRQVKLAAMARTKKCARPPLKSKGMSSTKYPPGTPLKADGTKDMRFSKNKEKKSTKSIPSAPPVPLKADGTPDRRFSAHKKSVEISKAPAEMDLFDRLFGVFTKPATTTTTTTSISSSSDSLPRRADGGLDMRHAVNRIPVAPTPAVSTASLIRADGHPDMRHAVNRTPVAPTPVVSATLPTRADGGLDMRHAVNRTPVVPTPVVRTAPPTRADGGLDMRYTANRTSTPVSSRAPTRADGGLDMRYTANRTPAPRSYSSPSYSSYSSSSSYSSGPCKADGSPDMRFKSNW